MPAAARHPVVYSFFQVSFVDIVPEITLKNYVRVFSTGPYLQLIVKALLTGVGIAAIAALIAYPVAFFIAKRVVGVKAALLTALLVPLYTGDLVRIFTWRLILGSHGVINGFLMWTGIIRNRSRSCCSVRSPRRSFSPTTTCPHGARAVARFREPG